MKINRIIITFTDHVNLASHYWPSTKCTCITKYFFINKLVIKIYIVTDDWQIFPIDIFKYNEYFVTHLLAVFGKCTIGKKIVQLNRFYAIVMANI